MEVLITVLVIFAVLAIYLLLQLLPAGVLK